MNQSIGGEIDLKSPRKLGFFMQLNRLTIFATSSIRLRSVGSYVHNLWFKFTRQRCFPGYANIKGRGKKDDQEEFQEILFKSLFSTWGWWWTSMVVFT